MKKNKRTISKLRRARKAGFKHSAKKSLNLKFHTQRLSLLVLGTSLQVREQNLCEMRTTAFHS
ncbi:hypothetical protein EB313_10420 [Salmonella enterica]|nr:hypothetical protein [Salmonella enterica]EBK3294682.1 hypothetical protein [Salmonella enterica]MDI15891.1 hypothetical protein [Salmonella enterica]